MPTAPLLPRCPGEHIPAHSRASSQQLRGCLFLYFFFFIVVVVVIYTLVRFQASTETLWVNLGSNCKTKTKMFSPPRSP